MANNRITVLIDVVTDRANAALGGFRKSITDADGAVGKFKAGAGAAMESIKANAGNLAMAGGAALVTFGAKSVAAFQETALAAGKLRDSLGVTAEEASRLMEVAEDLGIGTETLERSIGIMNRTATNTPAAFQAIGAELVKNADGTTNVNETFLATIDALKRIPDASARAAAAQKVFGRGWMEMAELIELGADGVRTALDSVEAGKIIDDAEVEQARRYRDALDALKGSVEELTIEVGGQLVPVLAEAAEALMVVKSVGSDLANLIPGPLKTGFEQLGEQVQRSLFWPKYFLDFRDALGEAEETTGTLGDSVTGYTDEQNRANEAAKRGKNIMSDVEINAGRLAATVDHVTDAFADLREELSDRSAYLDLQDTFDDVVAKGMAAFDGTAESAREYERAQIAATQSVLDYVDELGNVPEETTTKILAALDQGEVDRAEAILTQLTRSRLTRIQASVPKLVVDPNLRGPSSFGTVVVGATGGIVNRPTMALIGEAGPEAVVPLNKTPGNGPLPSGGLGGSPINLTVNAGMGANGPQIGAEIVRYLQEFTRRNGSGWVPR